MRSSGILMHITSLPGSYGVGTMGKQAFAFVDFLKKAGQSYWQVLPLSVLLHLCGQPLSDRPGSAD